MEPLKTSFEDRTFRWQQLERQADLAIFEQQHKTSGHRYYEVIKIRIQREHTWPNGTVTPEREAYPGATSWGRLGWTCWTLAEAQALLAQLQQAPVDDGAPQEEEPEEPVESLDPEPAG